MCHQPLCQEGKENEEEEEEEDRFKSLSAG